jgi:hypothetical protein
MKTTHFALVLALLAPACSGGATNVPTSTAQQAATKAPLAVRAQGPIRHLADAFAEVPLRPDQRAELESMFAAAAQRHQTMKTPGKELALALADQVEKGSIDQAALQPKIDAVVAAFKAAQGEDRKAIQRGHDLLDASQRQALVAALDAKHDDQEHEGKGPGHPMGPGAMHHGGPGMGFGEELGLSAEQKAKIFEAMKQEWMASQGNEAKAEHHGFGAWREQREKTLQAFVKDDFQVDRDMPAMDANKGAERMVEHGVRFAKIALPILTPEQRATAAKMIRDRAEKGEFPH